MWHLSEIPKVAHFYWDQECLPYLRYVTLLTFSKLNPDWELKLWQPFDLKSKLDRTWNTDEHLYASTPKISYRENLDQLSNLTINCIDQISPLRTPLNGVTFSDLLRWKLLSGEGGLWSDMDIVYIKPICDISVNNKKNSGFTSVVCREDLTFDCHFIGLLMSAPNNNYFKQVLELSSNKFDADLYQSVGSLLIENVLPKEVIYFNRNTIGNISFEDFYLYNPNEEDINSLFGGKLAKNFSHVVGIHWYAGSKPGSIASNEFDHLNYSKFNTSFSKIIEHVMTKLGARES